VDPVLSPNLQDETVLRRFLDSPPAAYCGKSGRFRWKERFSRAELREKLAKGLEGTLGNDFHGLPELTCLKVLSRTPRGRVQRLEIRSGRQAYTVSGDAIRWLWSAGKIGTGGLQSTLFYLLEEKDAVTIVGGGWGHGIGLCQQGAAGRAEAGQKYPEIIAHYYPGTRLTPILKRPLKKPAKRPAKTR
jgi:stage II sporulation protein D